MRGLLRPRERKQGIANGGCQRPFRLAQSEDISPRTNKEELAKPQSKNDRDAIRLTPENRSDSEKEQPALPTLQNGRRTMTL